MVDEVVCGLRLNSGGTWLDCTVGDGGHSTSILKVTGPSGFLLGLDKDEQGLNVARQVLEPFQGRFKLIKSSYAEMATEANRHGIPAVDGVLFDLGISSRQVEETGYGLSFNKSEDLDMRFDKSSELTAMDVVNEYSCDDLIRVFRDYGEERYSKRIARRIIEQRPLHTTSELASLVNDCIKAHAANRHPATRIFQALRIEVNQELEDLIRGLDAALSLLKSEGRMAVIAYHSLEDRIVKNFMRDKAKSCDCPKTVPVCICDISPQLKLINRKVIKPHINEINNNRRSRSARLRVAEKIA